MIADVVGKNGSGHGLFPVVLFRIKVGAVDGGIGGAASLFKLEEFVAGFGAEFLEEGLFELLEKEGERTADDENFGGFLIDDVDETEGEAKEEVFERGVVENEVLNGIDVVGVDESFSGGEIFPFGGLVFEGVFDVPRFKSVGGF